MVARVRLVAVLADVPAVFLMPVFLLVLMVILAATSRLLSLPPLPLALLVLERAATSRRAVTSRRVVTSHQSKSGLADSNH